MREHPNLEQLKRQAKELLSAFLAGDAHATAEVATHYGDANPKTFALHDAQLVLGALTAFKDWPKLKAYVDGVTAAMLKAAVLSGDIERVRHMLRLRPELVNMNLSGFYDYPLRYAVLERKADMVRLLLEKGADRVRERTVGRLGWRKSAAMMRSLHFFGNSSRIDRHHR
jgi:hypothetical protein